MLGNIINIGEFGKCFVSHNKLLPLARKAITRAVPSALSMGLLPLFLHQFAAGKLSQSTYGNALQTVMHPSPYLWDLCLIVHGLWLCGSLHRSFKVPFDQGDL